MIRTIRNYIFWTYERGSFHYDVMVTLILAFIFITPHFIDYRDRPIDVLHLHPSQTLVETDGGGNFTFQVRAADLPDSVADSPVKLQQALRAEIEPIVGDVRIDHYIPVLDPNNKLIAYKVWVKRL